MKQRHKLESFCLSRLIVINLLFVFLLPVAKEILTRNTDGFINFCGFMVGNPYVDSYTNTLAQFQAFYSHGLIAKPLYDAWVKSCSDPNSPPVVSFWGVVG